MKTLNEGITEKNFRKIVTCKKHQAIYEICADDIKISCTRKNTLFEYNKKVLIMEVKLPCGCTITLKNKEIPKVIKEVALKKLDALDLLMIYFS